MNDQIISQLNWRAAIKDYDTTKQVTEDQLQTLIETARLAPSSFGIQPVKLYVVKDQQIKEKLREAGNDQSQFSDSNVIFVLAARSEVTQQDIDDFVLRTSQQRNRDLASLENYKESLYKSLLKKSADEYHNWAAKQAYIVLGMMLSTAAFIQVDSSPMEGFSKQKFDEILDCQKDGFKAVVCLAVGFRSENDKYSKMPKVRKTTDEFVKVI